MERTFASSGHIDLVSLLRQLCAQIEDEVLRVELGGALTMEADTLQVEGAAPTPTGDYVTRTEFAGALKAPASTLER